MVLPTIRGRPLSRTYTAGCVQTDHADLIPTLHLPVSQPSAVSSTAVGGGSSSSHSSTSSSPRGESRDGIGVCNGMINSPSSSSNGRQRSRLSVTSTSTSALPAELSFDKRVSARLEPSSFISGTTRIAPVSLCMTFVATAFFVFSVFSSRNIDSFLFSSSKSAKASSALLSRPTPPPSNSSSQSPLSNTPSNTDRSVGNSPLVHHPLPFSPVSVSDTVPQPPRPPPPPPPPLQHLQQQQQQPQDVQPKLADQQQSQQQQLQKIRADKPIEQALNKMISGQSAVSDPSQSNQVREDNGSGFTVIEMTDDDKNSFPNQPAPAHRAVAPKPVEAAVEVASRAAPSPPPGNPARRVGWERSWPMSEQDDVTVLYKLARHLKFTNRTLLNYFHLHKTGGVSIKAGLIQLLTREENVAQLTTRGQPLRDLETCYKAVSPLSQVSVREVNWRCDFQRIREMSQDELRSYDVVLGHQYWEKGCAYHFGAIRDIEWFSVLRHPLSRKLSFFYHFFVRNAGVNETTVSRADVMQYVFGNAYDGDTRLRDGGVNYYASRFMSNGMSLFVDNQYRPPKSEEDAIIARVTRFLDDHFVFVGLQTQNDATNCMVEKTMQVFAHAHGIDTLIGTPAISDQSRQHLNKGQYTWTAQHLWASMSAEERARFRQVERIDLAIYEKAVQRFRESVKVFGCEHKVDVAAFEEDRFE